MSPTRLVLDTSVFVNPAARESLGATPGDALVNFLGLARSARDMEFYMPPSILEELMNFVKRDEVPAELLRHLIIKSPARYGLSVPALFLYELVEDMRERVNRGLRHAERTVRTVAQVGTDEAVRDLRRKYRDALREGIIDSKEDVDLILLAYELKATLVSADQGAVLWADKLGVACLPSERFREYVESAGDLSSGCRDAAEP